MSAYWPAIISIIGGIAVGLFTIVIRRLYKDDPESTSLFRALTANGDHK